jgi:hypothetical protein
LPVGRKFAQPDGKKKEPDLTLIAKRANKRPAAGPTAAL